MSVRQFAQAASLGQRASHPSRIAGKPFSFAGVGEVVRWQRRRQSIFAPESFTTFAHLACSDSMYAPNFSGVVQVALKP
jgi:hypothetical protein